MAIALVVGSTGLVGKELVQLLLENNSYTKVYTLQRKNALFQHPKLEVLSIDNFDDLSNLTIDKIDDVYCCLGTTIRKAGSKELFRLVDYEYPIKILAWTATKGAKHLIVVTAMGANPKSIFFYNKVKGELEYTLENQKLIPNVSIVQPSLLTGFRDEKRVGEKIGIFLSHFFNLILWGSLKKYRSIPAISVAKSMLYIGSELKNKGFQRYTSDQLKWFADKLIERVKKN
jgi:uncharacterized protein YbjT (DUF2867 family)